MYILLVTQAFNNLNVYRLQRDNTYILIVLSSFEKLWDKIVTWEGNLFFYFFLGSIVNTYLVIFFLFSKKKKKLVIFYLIFFR